MSMCQRAFENGVSFPFSERRCTGGQQSEYPPPLLMLVLVSDVCASGLDLVDSHDSGGDDQPD